MPQILVLVESIIGRDRPIHGVPPAPGNARHLSGNVTAVSHRPTASAP